MGVWHRKEHKDDKSRKVTKIGVSPFLFFFFSWTHLPRAAESIFYSLAINMFDFFKQQQRSHNWDAASLQINLKVFSLSSQAKMPLMIMHHAGKSQK